MKNNEKFIKIIKEAKKKFKGKKFFLHEPFITKIDYINLKKSLDNNEISTYGKYTQIFENKIKKYLKIKNVICLINGTSALHLALKTLGVNEENEIFVSSMTYISTVNAIKYCNAMPHFYDNDKNTLSIDLEKFENYLKKHTYLIKNKCINKKTGKHIKVLIVTHVNGLCCNIIKLKKILDKNKIKLVEDAAEALGCFFKGRALGTFGEAGILSFNGNKIITTGGGGALMFKSKKLHKYALHLSKNCKVYNKFDVSHDKVGFNYRMPSINASLGISQLTKIRKYLQIKKKLHFFYIKLFKDSNFKILRPIKECSSNYWLNTVIIKNKTKKKNYYLTLSNKLNFFVRPLWKPMHLLKPFRNSPKMNLSNTAKIYENTFSLPSSVFLLKNK